MITRIWAAAFSAAALAGLLAIAHLALVGTRRDKPGEEQSMVDYRRRGIKALVIGADGRASTSKFQVVLWTLAVLYAFMFLLVWGRSIGCAGVAADEPLCVLAAREQSAFDRFVEDPLEAEYYALLGLPTAAALAAKAMTQKKVVRGEITKPSVDESEEGSGVAKAVGEIIGGDGGESDLIDFQYAAFNVVALAYFLLEFTANPAKGLPEIPPTLLALSGVAVAAYSGKKALEKNVTPAVTAVIPTRVSLSPATRVTVIGAGFGDPRQEEVGRVLLAGFELEVDPKRWRDRSIEATLTPDVVDKLAEVGTAGPAEVAVVSADGSRSDSHPVELIVPRRAGRGEDG